MGCEEEKRIYTTTPVDMPGGMYGRVFSLFLSHSFDQEESMMIIVSIFNEDGVREEDKKKTKAMIHTTILNKKGSRSWVVFVG